VKCDLDVGLPVDGELLPALLVQGRGGRKRAGAEHQDVGLKDVEDLGRRTFIRCIELQSFEAGNLFGQQPKRPLLGRDRKHARRITGSGSYNLPPNSSATADHDHLLSCQRGHFFLLLRPRE
jgi:hypothetical protein